MEITPTATQTLGESSSGKAANSFTGLADDFDDFLILLTTQLQHQDPLAPTDTNEFTNQLVQFASIEQQVQQNTNLEKLIDLQGQNQAIGALSFMGRTIEAQGNTNMLIDGETTFTYRLPENASGASISIFDSSGELVFQEAAPTDAGLHDIVWDGSTNAGGLAPDGAYSFLVTAIGRNDAPLDVTHGVVGVVSGISFENGETILGIGNVAVPLDNVTGILEPQNAASSDS
ncbi:MAG: flagellar hook assembly protein FlgD [Alphaproteobacteria bacterium]|nr:flagellar hook assembly protein FlgD [Alphaproteobacteria bacterium]